MVFNNFYNNKQTNLSRGATEQSTLAEGGKFHENSIPTLRVDYSCAYNNLLMRLRSLGNKKEITYLAGIKSHNPPFLT